MSEGKTIRISKVLKDVNISLSTAAEELKKHKNIEIDASPNTWACVIPQKEEQI